MPETCLCQTRVEKRVCAWEFSQLSCHSQDSNEKKSIDESWMLYIDVIAVKRAKTFIDSHQNLKGCSNFMLAVKTRVNCLSWSSTLILVCQHGFIALHDVQTTTFCKAWKLTTLYIRWIALSRTTAVPPCINLLLLNWCLLH